MRRSGSVPVGLVAGLLLVSALLGCAAPEPTASNAVPPPASVDPDPLVWAALGGDETLVGDRDATAGAWTQRVLAGLDPSAQLLDVATEDATVGDGLSRQLVALQASPAVPTVATIWFGSADGDTASSRYRAGLTELVGGLRDAGVGRIVVVTRTDPGSTARAVDARAVAEAEGLELVEVSAITGDPRDPEVQAEVAGAIGPAVAG